MCDLNSLDSYLLTWYGITDFKASLGFEESKGPILSAILAEKYTDVFILGYSKNMQDSVKEEQETKDFYLKLDEINKTLENVKEKIFNFIKTFANTKTAHNHFVAWLKKEISNSKVAVHLAPVFLSHLNDTETIYEAATKSLTVVEQIIKKREASIPVKKAPPLVTLYLSPGTPVMAFVWAFAALRHPNLQKRLLASPQADKLPEQISLPSEWLEWHSKRIENVAECDDYEVIFHLFGEQRIPSYHGISQFKTKHHIFVTSKEYSSKDLKKYLFGALYSEINIDPYNLENIRDTILKKVTTTVRLMP